MLAKFGRKSMADVAQSIVSFDGDKLSLGTISALLETVHTMEETRQVQSFWASLQQSSNQLGSVNSDEELHTGGETIMKRPKKLERAEEYVFEMSKVKNLKQRLAALAICLSIQNTSTMFETSLTDIVKACEEVKGSSRLRYILQSVLLLANTINNPNWTPTSPLSEVKGLKLSSLPRLTTYRTNSGETLERFIVSRLYESLPGISDLEKDMPSLEKARMVALDVLTEELKRLQQGKALLEQLLRTDNAVAIDQDVQKQKQTTKIDEFAANEEVFYPIPTTSLDRMQQKLADVTSLLSKAQSCLDQILAAFVEVCEYFGEDPAALDPERLFSTLLSFVRSVQTSLSLCAAKKR